MSVRSKIKEFEKLSQKEAESQEKENLNRKNETKKRFHFPGNTRNADGDGEHGGHSFVLGNKTTKATQDLDADLQEVWSVRKNIHHKGKSMSGHPHPHHPHHPHHHHHQGGQLPTSTAITSNATPSTFKSGSQNIPTPAHYSRHGAIPALPVHPNQVQPLSSKDVGRGFDSLRQDEGALQDCQASPWNVKKMAYSYNASNGAPVKNIASPPPGDAALMPSPKRRMNIGGGLDIVRPTGEHRPGGLMMGNKGTTNEKVNYARRMAQGYLKSVGMGDYTPKASNFSKVKLSEQSSNSLKSSPNKWKKRDDQDKEFDFDI